jgi:NADH-quinone oxidoreductase subunit N
MPPLSGFIGKFAIFAAVTEAYQQSRAQGLPAGWLLILLVAGGINTAISLFYYLRVVKVMTMDDEPRERPPFAFSDVSLAGAYLWLITVPTVGLIFSWNWLSDLAVAAARQLF